MEFEFHHHAPPSPCSYRPEEAARLDFVQVAELSADEYANLLLEGWRRFGRTLFRPRCPTCRECRSLRVDVAQFRPDRGQRRVQRANEPVVRLDIGTPRVTVDVIRLFEHFHEVRSLSLGWPSHDSSPLAIADSFVDNPFPSQEWRYALDDELVGVGYVDELTIGLSAIYFVHDPDHARRSLGAWNVLCLIQRARALGLPHVYLGYHVADCRSLAYKARFRPNEVRGADGRWRPFSS